MNNLLIGSIIITIFGAICMAIGNELAFKKKPRQSKFWLNVGLVLAVLGLIILLFNAVNIAFIYL
jgi:uncharacterized membrane protein